MSVLGGRADRQAVLNRAYEVLTQKSPSLSRERRGGVWCINGQWLSPTTVVDLGSDLSDDLTNKINVCIQRLVDFYAVAECCYQGLSGNGTRVALRERKAQENISETPKPNERSLELEAVGQNKILSQRILPPNPNKRKQVEPNVVFDDFLDPRRDMEDSLPSSDRPSKKSRKIIPPRLEYIEKQRWRQKDWAPMALDDWVTDSDDESRFPESGVDDAVSDSSSDDEDFGLARLFEEELVIEGTDDAWQERSFD